MDAVRLAEGRLAFVQGARKHPPQFLIWVNGNE